MFRDREGGDCKGNTQLCLPEAEYKGSGQIGYGDLQSSIHLRWQFQKKKNTLKRGRGGDASSVRLEYHWTFFCRAFFLLTSIAAYGVTPHIKSVSTETGQDRPRPRFPALLVAGPPRWVKPSRPLGVTAPRPLVCVALPRTPPLPPRPLADP